MQARNGSIIITVIICTILLGLFTLWISPVIPESEVSECPTAQEIADLIVVGDNQDVIDILNEDDDWEDEAEVIATSEWEKSDYKDIYKALDNIDDRDDISYVRESEDTEFISINIDDKDAHLKQFVKVKYEDEEGQNQKVYLTIETWIEEGEVEDQEIAIDE